MYVLLDRTNLRPIARSGEYIALAALAYIQFANVDASIFRCGSDAQYGPLDNSEIRAIAASMGVTLPPGKRPQLIGPFRKLVEETDYLHLPFDVDQLHAQACAIEPEDSRPYAFNPNSADTPELLQKWHFEPNRNRPRWECQHWVNFTTKPHQLHNETHSGGQSAQGDWNPLSHSANVAAPRTSRDTFNPENDQMAAKKEAAPKAPAKKAPAKVPNTKKAKPVAPAKGAKAPAAPKAEKAPKAERISANGVKRPQAGTTGDKIWSAADKLSAKLKRPATYEEVAAELGDTVAEGSSRTGYQRWRRFNGLKGRLPKADK